jgi:excisionase family DNA binding protein
VAYILLKQSLSNLIKSSKKYKKKRNLMSPKENKNVLTTQEAIEYLRISKPTFYKSIHSGRIKAIKVGNGWRVLRSELIRIFKVKHEQAGR